MNELDMIIMTINGLSVMYIIFMHFKIIKQTFHTSSNAPTSIITVIFNISLLLIILFDMKHGVDNFVLVYIMLSLIIISMIDTAELISKENTTRQFSEYVAIVVYIMSMLYLLANITTEIR